MYLQLTFDSKYWNLSPNFPIVLDFLYANSAFAVFAWNVSTANYEGRLYISIIFVDPVELLFSKGSSISDVTV